MPRIPMYERQVDGAVGSRLNYAEVSPDAYGAGIGRAMQRAGDMVGQALEQRQVKQDAAAEDAERIAATRGIAQLQADTLTDISDARTKIAADGSGHAEAVTGRFDARATTTLEGIKSPRVRAWAETQLIERRARVLTGEMEYAAGQSAAKVVGDFAAARKIAEGTLFADGDEKLFEMTLGSQVSAIESMTALPQDKKAELKAETVARLSEAYARGMRERDPYKLRAMIDDGAFTGLLDLQDLASIRNGADTEIRGREAAARQEEQARLQAARARNAEIRQAERDAREDAGDYVQGISAALSAGVPVPMETVANAARMAGRLGNPGQAVTIATLGTRAAVNQSYAGLSPIELQRAEQGLSAKIAKAGANAAPTDIAARDQLVRLRATQKAATATDLLGWEARRGVVVPDLDPANPASYAEREKIVREASRRYGVPQQPLRSTEVDAWQQRLSTGTPAQKAAAVAELTRFPTMARAAAAQIAAKDPLAGHGVGLAATGKMAHARWLFAGADALKANPKIAPNVEVDEAFEELVGSAFAFMPRGRDVVKQAATAIYAGRWAAEGGTEWRDKAFSAGLDMALGGTTDANGDKRGGLGEWRGRPVVLPDGMTQDGFEDRVAAVSDAMLVQAGDARPVDDRGRPVPADLVRRGHLFAYGDNRYLVRLPGASAPVRSANGDLFVLRLSRQ